MSIQEQYGQALSLHEMLIMKAVYDLGGEKVSKAELARYLKLKYELDYARTTIVTFLQRIEGKGYLISFRIGRESYVTATISKDTFVHENLQAFCNLWFEGHWKNLQNYILTR